MDILLQDTLFTLPLLMMGSIFFLGILSSNTGLLYLFFGQLLVVPALSFLSNDKGFLFENGSLSAYKVIKTILSFGIFLFVNTIVSPFNNSAITGGLFGTLSFLMIVSQLYSYHKGNGQSTSIFNSINFISSLRDWIAGTTDNSESNQPSAICSIIPGSGDEDLYNNPSVWLTHISFLIGFLFTNALTLFNQPIPTLTQDVNDPNYKARKAALDERVTNRKYITGSIMASIVFIYIVLLYLRYSITYCEAPFMNSILPLGLTLLTGSSWFSFLQKNCGVKPSDVIGIVQGMISPNLIDNPIICTGSL